MLLTASLYTTLVVTLNVIAQGGGSNLYKPEDHPTFTPAEVKERIYGSKIVIVSEQAMLNLVYSIKACMLVMYTRLTLGLTTQRLVRYLSCYVAVGWLASQIAFFAACRPFKGYWGMPPPDPQCTTLEHYSIAQACFNISSDSLMLFVPLPLILRTTMPLKQKAVLSVIFSMGLFVIVAALLTKIFNLSNVWDPQYMLWYVREASVAVYVSNLPMIWPLLREWFPWLSGLTPGGTSSGGKGRKGKYAGDGSRGAGGTYVQYGGSRNGHETVVGGRRGEVGMGGSRTRTGRVNSLGSLDSAYDLELVLKDVKGSRESRKYKGDDSSSTEQIVPAVSDDGLVEKRAVAGSRESIGVAMCKMGGIQVERTVVVREESHVDRDSEYVVGVGTNDGLFDWQRTRRGAEHRADARRGGDMGYC